MTSLRDSFREFFDFIIALKLQLFVGILVAIGIAGSIQIFKPAEYFSEALIMPITKKDSGMTSQFMSQLPLAVLGGDGLGGNELTTYREILLSQKILEPVARKCFEGKDSAEINFIVRELKRRLGITVTKGQLLKILLQYPAPPEKVACLVNEMTPVLITYLEEKGVSRAKAKRVFLEQQMQERRTELANIQKQMISFSEESRTITLNSQFMKQLEESSQAFLQQSKLEVQRSFLQTFFPEATETLTHLNEQIQKTKDQLKDLAVLPSRGQDTATSFQKIPMLSLIYAQLKQQQGTAIEMIGILSQQYEAARLDEVEQKSRFEILEQGVVASRPNAPNLSFNLIAFILLAMALILGWGFYTKSRFSSE